MMEIWEAGLFYVGQTTFILVHLAWAIYLCFLCRDYALGNDMKNHLDLLSFLAGFTMSLIASCLFAFAWPVTIPGLVLWAVLWRMRQRNVAINKSFELLLRGNNGSQDLN